MSPPPVESWTERPPSTLDQIALRWFGETANRRMINHPDLGDKLHRAGIATVPPAFLAGVYLRSLLMFLVGVPLLLMAIAVGATNDLAVYVLLVGSPTIAAALTYSYLMLRPDLLARARARSLDENLPYAINFMATMAGAGVLTVDIWKALGSQNVYGQAAEEARNIHRDTQVFSKDLVTAMRDAARRSPSTYWADFLNGSVNTVGSGGDLRTYLVAKAEYYQQENRRRQRSLLENLGVMAESYVVVGAAAPLFLIVVMSIMVLTNGGRDPTSMLNLMVLLAMPVIHAAFSFIIHNTEASD